MDGRDILCGQQLLILLQPAINDVEINRKTLYKPRKIVAGRLKKRRTGPNPRPLWVVTWEMHCTNNHKYEV